VVIEEAIRAFRIAAWSARWSGGSPSRRMSASICLSRNSRNAGHEGSPCCITTVGRGGGLCSFSVLDASGRNPPLIPEPECRERAEWRLRNLPRVLRQLEFHYPPSRSAGSTWLRSSSARSKANVSTATSKAEIVSLARSAPAGPARPKRRPHHLDVLYRQSQNQNGAHLSQSLAQRVIIIVRGN
jgi:hypothetical protein